MKHIELFENGFDETIIEKIKPENWPYIGYSPSEGFVFSVNHNYLCLEPLEENNQLALFKLGDFSNITYSFDKKSWNNFPVDSNNPFNITYITVDKPIYLRGNNPNGVVNIDELQGCKLTGLGKYNVSGDITTLLNEVGDVNDLTPYGTYGVFSHLFAEYGDIPCVDIVDASKLILPSTVLADNCYFFMFANCTTLTSAPELPAMELANGCYSYMFNGCTALTTTPELPATILAEGCYAYMFYGCTSLTTASELPATMLVKSCYERMFETCAKLNYIKCLATDISANYCTYSWVFRVSSTGTFIKHPNMNSWTTGHKGIPSGWTVVDTEI